MKIIVKMDVGQYKYMYVTYVSLYLCNVSKKNMLGKYAVLIILVI